MSASLRKRHHHIAIRRLVSRSLQKSFCTDGQKFSRIPESRISRERLLKRSQIRCVMAPTIHRGDVMTRTLSRIAALVAIFIAQATFACAAEIKVYATIGVKHSLEDLTAKFEKTSGHNVSITWCTGARLAKRIQ